MKQTTKDTAQLLTPPFGGRGAKKYIAPRIEWIPLDSDISLQLQSVNPPGGPGETSLSPTYLKDNPFKCNMG